MALLYAPGEGGENEAIRGVTKLVKLLFLLDKEGGFGKYLSLSEDPEEPEGYEFEAYNFGPYSDEIYEDIEMLKEENLLDVVRERYNYYAEAADRHESISRADLEDSTEADVEIFSLSSNGEKIGKLIFENELSEEERNKLVEIKKKYNSIPLHKLLKYVYEKYPEVTTESLIKDKVLK